MADEHVCPERHFPPVDTDALAGDAPPGREFTLLVELSVGRQVLLRYDSYYLPLSHGNRAVVEASAVYQGRARNEQQVVRPGHLRKGHECLAALSKEKVLTEKVTAGVARNSELGQHQHLSARFVSLPRHFGATVQVILDAAYLHLRKGCRYSVESICIHLLIE